MKSRHAALAAVIVLPAAPAEAHERCNTTRCIERVAAKRCSRQHPIACLRRGALHWRVPTAVLVRKARCESRLRWWAYNSSGATGLLQFLPSTWLTTPYADKPIWSVKWQGLAGGFMIDAGRGGEWSCR